MPTRLPVMPGRRAVLGGLVAAAASLALPHPSLAMRKRKVIVSSNGWHTGIVLPPSPELSAAVPEIADFGEAAFFEFGWGDADYYPAERPTFGMAMGAAFPGPAVVHLAALPDHPAHVFPDNEWTAHRITPDGKERLLVFLSEAFDRNGAPRVAPKTDGLYPFSLFYPATGRFSLANTCNTWVARGLGQAGLAVDTAGVQRASDVMRQTRPIADLGSGGGP